MIEQIVDFVDLEDLDSESIFVGNATFKKDFGPFKKGDRVDSLVLSYVSHQLIEFDEQGMAARSVKVLLVPDDNTEKEEK